MKIIGAIFEKMKILNLFLCVQLLIFGIGKKKARNIYKRTLDIEFEWDWSDGLGATLGDWQKIKNYFTSFRDYFGKMR